MNTQPATPAPKRIADIDGVAYAARIAQFSAAEIARLLGPEDEKFDPQLWPNAGGVCKFGDDDTGEAAITELAGYCASRKETPSGEQLYIRARELGIHQESGAYAERPLYLCMAYDNFAAAAWLAAHSLAQAAAAEIQAEEHAAAKIKALIEAAAVKAYGKIRDHGRGKGHYLPEWDEAAEQRANMRMAVEAFVTSGFSKSFEVSGKDRKLNTLFRDTVKAVFDEAA